MSWVSKLVDFLFLSNEERKMKDAVDLATFDAEAARKMYDTLADRKIMAKTKEAIVAIRASARTQQSTSVLVGCGVKEDDPDPDDQFVQTWLLANQVAARLQAKGFTVVTRELEPDLNFDDDETVVMLDIGWKARTSM